MKKVFIRLVTVAVDKATLGLGLLFFRFAVSAELTVVHGLKKIGWGVPEAEKVPNPLQFPELLNQSIGIAANLVCPLFIILGLFTRVAALPVLAVTLTGYFVQHWNDSLLDKDIPFMYSICFGLIIYYGAGTYSLDQLIHNKLTNPAVRINRKRLTALKGQAKEKL